MSPIFSQSRSDPENVRAYLLHLIEQCHVSWGYYNLHLQALRFLYNVTQGCSAVARD